MTIIMIIRLLRSSSIALRLGRVSYEGINVAILVHDNRKLHSRAVSRPLVSLREELDSTEADTTSVCDDRRDESRDAGKNAVE